MWVRRRYPSGRTRHRRRLGGFGAVGAPNGGCPRAAGRRTRLGRVRPCRLSATGSCHFSARLPLTTSSLSGQVQSGEKGPSRNARVATSIQEATYPSGRSVVSTTDRGSKVEAELAWAHGRGRAPRGPAESGTKRPVNVDTGAVDGWITHDDLARAIDDLDQGRGLDRAKRRDQTDERQPRVGRAGCCAGRPDPQLELISPASGPGWLWRWRLVRNGSLRADHLGGGRRRLVRFDAQGIRDGRMRKGPGAGGADKTEGGNGKSPSAHE